MWRVFGATSEGASHASSGRPNQDAVAWLPDDGAGSRVVLSVSDGHGGKAYFRSHIGARLAVQTATRLGATLLGRLEPRASPVLLQERVATELAPQLTAAWAAEVRAHHRDQPFTEAELEGRTPTSSRQDDVLVAYGATVLTALVSEHVALLLQVGDGDALAVTPEGRVTRPVPGDERLVAGETTSLCLPKAHAYARVAAIDLSAEPLAFLMLATDGYGNTFADADWHMSVGADLLAHLVAEGPDWVAGRLGDWIVESARVGGDDVTVGLVARAPGASPPAVGARDALLTSDTLHWSEQ